MSYIARPDKQDDTETALLQSLDALSASGPTEFLQKLNSTTIINTSIVSGGPGFQVATGVVDGSNLVFSFPSSPNVMCVDGVTIQKVSNDGTVNWTGTTSITLLIAPNFSIFAIA